MYLELFGLHEHPFRLTPDPSFLYLSKQHSQAKAYMDSTVLLTDGFVVITGEIGSGKTTLIEKFLADLEGQEVITAKIYQTQVTPVQFLQGLLVEFGFKPFRKQKAELLSILNQFIIEQYSRGKRVVIIVDEAQNLSVSVLEEIRLLSGIETQKDKVVSIILAGQPELADVLDAPEMEQLSQRTRLRYHLKALSEQETKEYILHRLSVAGASDREIFAQETFETIFKYSGGVPRLINTLCDTAMICAYADNAKQVTSETMGSAIDELQWVEYAARTGSRFVGRQGLSLGRPSIGTLRLLHEGDVIKEFQLHQGRMIVGRTADNDIQINSEYVSRHHAQVITSVKGSTVEDLNSTNGIYVNSQRVKKRKLRHGDEVEIGTHFLQYFVEEVEEMDEEELSGEG
ncbi:MAG: AAA family ATPase [Pseudomonadota bacterium]